MSQLKDVLTVYLLSGSAIHAYFACCAQVRYVPPFSAESPLHRLTCERRNSTGLRFNDIDMCASPLGGPDARPDREREWCFNRTLNPVRYYYTSLSELQKYAPDATFRTEVGYEYDIYVPEFLRQEDCDPFAADVYRLGHSFRADFTEVRVS